VFANMTIRAITYIHARRVEGIARSVIMRKSPDQNERPTLRFLPAWNRRTPPKVGSGELDAERRNAAHRAFWASRKGNPIKVSIDAAIRAYLAVAQGVDTFKPCGLADPGYQDCKNMKEVGGGMEGERYRCDVCGKSYFLDYEDMK
jgi:hypothetical protein